MIFATAVLVFEGGNEMTSQSTCDRDQTELIEPGQTDDVTIALRAFEWELYNTHKNMVRSWLRELIPESLQKAVDVVQLELLILLELIDDLRYRVNEVHIDRSETIPFCKKITKHRAQNAVRDAHAQKRDCDRESTEVDTAVLPHRREWVQPV